MRRIWSLGALGEGIGWDLRIRPAASEIWEPGNLGMREFGDLWGLETQKLEILGTWKSRNLGSKKWKKKILKIQIRSAQNVGKVRISRKKILLALFGAI